MQPQTVLITGAGGFIGAALGDFLAAQGLTVVGIDVRFADLNQPPTFRFEVADFRDVTSISGLADKVDTVVHLASAHLDVSASDDTYWEINVCSLRPFLEDIRSLGAKHLVHVSSVGVYGDLEAWPANEETECAPQSIYGETKLAGEKVVRQFCDESDFSAVILRPAWVYGPTCPRTARLVRALRDGKFVMIGRGNNMRHPLYIEDMNQAVSLAIEAKGTPGEVYVVGGEHAITTNDLVESICRLYGYRKPRLKLPLPIGAAAAFAIEKLSALVRHTPPVSRRTLEFFRTNNAFDISKATTRLGFIPQYGLESGLMECRKKMEHESLIHTI